MSNLTPELNLVQAEDDDDTADYLVLPNGLAGSLAILDGMFSAGAGHAHNGAHQGGTLGPNAFADNTIPGAKLVDGSVTAIKLAAGIVGPEGVFANTRVNTGTNYTVVEPVMFVFCTAAVTITLPAAASTNRPITVTAISGQSSVNSAGGSVFGGSANLTTGAVQHGVVAVSESFTYKSNGTNWYAV
jgi:hypothetical protein